MVRSFLRSDIPTDGVPSSKLPSVGFISSLWAAFTLTVRINTLYNERVHGKEEHAT